MFVLSECVTLRLYMFPRGNLVDGLQRLKSAFFAPARWVHAELVSDWVGG